MSAQDVDAYLQGIEEPKRRTLETLRRTILEVVTDAEQVISYRVPAFRVQGKTIAGFAAFKEHPVTCRSAARCFHSSRRSLPATR